MVTPVSTSPSRVTNSVAALALMAVTALGATGCVATSRPAADTASSPAPSPTDSPAQPTSPPTTSAHADERLTAPVSTRIPATCGNITDPSSDLTLVSRVLPEGAIKLPPMPVLARGADCVSSQGSDDSYDWSPASEKDWNDLVALYTANDSAWFTEDGPRGTYLTYKIDGRYSQTFLFTGDAVILAPTKAATDAVIGPPLA